MEAKCETKCEVKCLLKIINMQRKERRQKIIETIRELQQLIKTIEESGLITVVIDESCVCVCSRLYTIDFLNDNIEEAFDGYVLSKSTYNNIIKGLQSFKSRIIERLKKEAGLEED